MNTVVVASSAQDAEAVEAVKQHHAEMAGTLAALAGRLLTAADADAASRAREALVTWARSDLVPHAEAEESALYPLAHADTRGRLLVEAMIAEHRLLTSLLQQLAAASDQVSAAATAQALSVLFESHLAKENDQILPLLAKRSDVALMDVLGGLHELLGGHDGHAHDGHAGPEHAHGHGHPHGDAEGPAGGCGSGSHSCACGESDAGELPELDARVVPHAIRHATVFGALDAVRPGGGMVLVAPHDPLPLLSQIEARNPGVFTTEYLERGPEAWRIRFLRAS